MKSIFGLKGKYYIELSPDNRIKLWNTVAQKEVRFYVEKQHLNRSYSCLTWFQAEPDNLGLFAVGASDGSVIVWELLRGVVLQEFKIAHDFETAVTGLVFSVDGSSLYVTSSSKYLSVYSTKTGALLSSINIGKNGISALTINPRVDIVAVGRYFTVLRLFIRFYLTLVRHVFLL